MHKELDNYLCQKYPKIFANRNLPINQSCMAWGFTHGDGWFFLIDALCAAIQGYIDQHNDWVEKYGKKFADEDAANGEPPDPSDTVLIPQVVASQVKEKFGGLRFYYTGGDEYIQGMVRLAEHMSYRTCEECGVVNELVNVNSNGWIRTTCPCCARKEDKESHTENRRTELVEIWSKVHQDATKAPE